jgi:site-specific recombinase XerD
MRSQDHSFRLFFSSIRLEQTRKIYATSLRKYVEFLSLEQKDISLANDARLIESKIIDFIISLKEKGMSYSAVHNYLSCIVSFYKLNDIILNTKNIGKFMSQQKRAKKDRSYSHEARVYAPD